MGQYEIIYWLKKQRDIGNDGFFKITEVRNGLKTLGCPHNTVGQLLLALERTKVVEATMNWDLKDWHRIFRLTNESYERLKKMDVQK